MPSAPKYKKPSKDNLYFSFWSWGLLKDCPQSFYLNVIKRPEKRKRDVGHAVQGSIPDILSENFFAMDPKTRDTRYFLDKKVFSTTWDQFLGSNSIDWLKQAEWYAKKMNMRLPENWQNNAKRWAGWALELKRKETELHTQNMVKLITALGLVRMKTESQVNFRVELEPERVVDGERIPSLSIGGRIDLVVYDGSYEDIWDVKAVRDANKLDVDQLIMYRMGRRAEGKIVRTTGYLLARQCKIQKKKITDSHEYELRRLLRVAHSYFRKDVWPANWRPWWCPKYCDVSGACPEHQKRTERNEELDRRLQQGPGKVTF